MASENIMLDYKFNFTDGSTKQFSINLEGKTLELIKGTATSTNDWALLKSNQCPNCTLYPEKNPYCPIALNLSDIIAFFKDCISSDKAEITICSEKREFRRKASLQEGLSAMIGIYMVTSGCPVMDRLRPMVYTHLPFATVEETMYRAASMYLLAQYFLNKEGVKPDWELKGLVEIYEDVNQVNQYFRKRLLEINPKDASLNALFHLDCFAVITNMSIVDDCLSELRGIFHPYFKERLVPA